MSEIPRITGAEAVRAFQRAGFVVVRTSGSHHILKKGACRISIPVHRGKTVGKGLLAAQLKLSGLTVDQFKTLL